MRKIDLDMQGRIFAMQMSITKLSLPLAALLTGPLCDRVFQPLIEKTPFLATFAGGVEGRGTALMAVLLGLSNLFVAACIYLYPPYRELDKVPVMGESWQHRE